MLQPRKNFLLITVLLVFTNLVKGKLKLFITLFINTDNGNSITISLRHFLAWKIRKKRLIKFIKILFLFLNLNSIIYFNNHTCMKLVRHQILNIYVNQISIFHNEFIVSYLVDHKLRELKLNNRVTIQVKLLLLIAGTFTKHFIPFEKISYFRTLLNIYS